MKAILRRRLRAGLVGGWQVSHPMSSAACRLPLSETCSPVLMTAQAEIFFLIARLSLQQLVLVVARVRIVARQAIAHSRRMHRSLDIRGLLVRMAGDAQRDRGRRDQFYPRHILVDPDLVAAQAASLHRRVHKLVLGLVVVALQALLGIRVFIQRNRVYRAPAARSATSATNADQATMPSAATLELCDHSARTMREEGAVS